MTKMLTDYPELLKEWHPIKNGNLNPKIFKHRSNKKVWWLCSFGHKCEATVESRTSKKNCPYYAGQKVCESNGINFVPQVKFDDCKYKNKLPFDFLFKPELD